MSRHQYYLLKIILCAFLFYALWDYAVVRSGLYFRVIEPESTVGSVLLYRTVIEQRLDRSRANILVVGDSRVGEGFSAKLANRIAGKSGPNFIGCGISGSTPRVWRYFLRSVDHDRTKFSAIVLMTSALTDDEIYEDLGNRTSDMNYCLPLLSYSDLYHFPETFSDKKLLDRARWAIVFPLAFLQSDIRGFILHPIARAQKASFWRSGYPDWIYDYPARPEALPNFAFETNSIRPRDWQGVSDPLKSQLEGYFAELSGGFQHLPLATVASYRRTWYGGIAADYASTGVPVYVFLMPRGPFHAQLKGLGPVTGSLASLASSGSIRLLDPKPFSELEIPANFFDHLHLNAVGREKLTQCLVKTLALPPQ